MEQQIRKKYYKYLYCIYKYTYIKVNVCCIFCMRRKWEKDVHIFVYIGELYVVSRVDDAKKMDVDV